jgi:hypothetical protein
LDCAHSDPPSPTTSPISPSDGLFTGRQPDFESTGCYLVKVRDNGLSSVCFIQGMRR